MARNFNFAPKQPVSGFKKADAFVNIYLPLDKGGRKQIGAIALHADDDYHAQIIGLLNVEDEAAQVAALKKFINAIEVNFVPVDNSAEAAKFAF
jgi:hypothetical protein